MEKIELVLNKTKETKNKIVYGEPDGTVIQSLYIDRAALGTEVPEAILLVITPKN